MNRNKIAVKTYIRLLQKHTEELDVALECALAMDGSGDCGDIIYGSYHDDYAFKEAEVSCIVGDAFGIDPDALEDMAMFYDFYENQCYTNHGRIL